MKDMGGYFQANIISAALFFSCSLTQIAVRGAACKQHLLTEAQSNYDQARIITSALRSSCPVSSYAARGATCRKHLFMEEMDGFQRTDIILTILHLTDKQMSRIVRECAARPLDNGHSRSAFIFKRAKELQAEN